jgi:hypothetical protein
MPANEYDIDWAVIIDILAKEYGWTIEYIKSLDLGQITTLLQAIKARYDKQNNNEESSDDVSDLKSLGGKEIIREDGRKEIVI